MIESPALLDETFHALAQPVMALRATVEMGLAEEPDRLDAQRVLHECLRLINALTQQMALMREIASTDDTAELTLCDGAEILQSCIEEMAPVAHESGVVVLVNASAAAFLCNEALLRRALFLLLDGMLAGMPHGGEVSLRLFDEGDGMRLRMFPEVSHGLRQKLCWKLMLAAGGKVITCVDGGTAVLFQK